jgi:DNA-binding NarL/FixJ family response regulator
VRVTSDTASTAAISCLIADDHPAVVDSISRYLAASGMTICATASNGDDALRKLERCRPQVAVLDIHMPGVNGAALIEQAKKISPETAAIVYTGDADRGGMTDVLDAGARGFVLKEAPLVDLVRAIEMAADGSMYIDPSLTWTLLHGPEVVLSERERQVLRLVAEGMSNDQVAGQLFISSDTVRAHLSKACRKLGARTRTQAVVTALRLQLIG